MAGFHHVELWIADGGEEREEWAWLLGQVGFVLESEWDGGQSWSAGGAYLTLTASPNVTVAEHDRRRFGMNHLAFKASSPGAVDEVMAVGPSHGWFPLYQDRYPYAGGVSHYAGWLENSEGFKVEVVADGS